MKRLKLNDLVTKQPLVTYEEPTVVGTVISGILMHTKCDYAIRWSNGTTSIDPDYILNRVTRE